MTINLNTLYSTIAYTRSNPDIDTPAIVEELPMEVLDRIAIKLHGKLCDAPETYRAHFIEAMEDVMVDLGAKRVAQDALHDCGLDPRFTFDGNFLLPTEESAKSRSVFQSFLLNQKEKCILACADAEAKWSAYTQELYLTFETAAHIQRAPLAQHLFFQTLGELSKQLLPNRADLPLRPYPSELMTPIHAMQKPQNGKQPIKGDAVNGDLMRVCQWGFWRLSKTYCPEEGYIRHEEFIDRTDAPSVALRNACRNVRKALIAIKSEFDKGCGKPLALAKKHHLEVHLEDFHEKWHTYVESHDVVNNAYTLWSAHNLFEHIYKREDACQPELRRLYELSGMGDANAVDERISIKNGLKELKEEANKKLFQIAEKHVPDLVKGVNI